MPKTPPLDKAKALRSVMRELQTREVAGTLIPDDEPVSIPGELVKMLRREFPDRSTSWIYETAEVIRRRSYPKQVDGVIFTMASSGMNDTINIQPAEQAERREELKGQRREWGKRGGRPRKADATVTSVIGIKVLTPPKR